MKYAAGILLLLMCFCFAQSQDQPSTVDKAVNIPSSFFNKINSKMSGLDADLTRQTQKYLGKLAKREERLRRKIYRIDSTGAKSLFGQGASSYEALAQKMKMDTGNAGTGPSGEYLANVDSLKGTLSFLRQHPNLLGASARSQQLQQACSQLRQLQARMQDADQVKAFIRDRKEQIRQYLARYAHLPPGLAGEFQGMQKEQYYYAEQVREYKEMLNQPDVLAQKALAVLNQLGGFRNFMRSNSQLAGLFGAPANYGTPQGLAGLQTRDQLDQLLQGQVGSSAGATAAMQQNLQAAHEQLDQFKDKLSQLGSGSGDMEMPKFKPNDQKTKTFLKRLEIGTNIQTTQSSYYYPTTVDLGLSIGYRFTNTTTAGVGGAYKLGTGNGIQYISFSSQGVSLRSFFDSRIKGSFFASGGLEYNYQQPFNSYQQIRSLQVWQSSGLAGLSKIVSSKGKAIKKTKLSLLWDFLSYQQVPKTQPFKFRVGYAF